MDKDLLSEKGIVPSESGLAYVSGYGLRIGARATLEISTSERAFGSLMQISDKELQILYGEKSVAGYVPQELIATDIQGKAVPAIAYILPKENVTGRNAEYAYLLAEVARKIGLPGEYIKEIEAWI